MPFRGLADFLGTDRTIPEASLTARQALTVPYTQALPRMTLALPKRGRRPRRPADPRTRIRTPRGTRPARTLSCVAPCRVRPGGAVPAVAATARCQAGVAVRRLRTVSRARGVSVRGRRAQEAGRPARAEASKPGPTAGQPCYWGMGLGVWTDGSFMAIGMRIHTVQHSACCAVKIILPATDRFCRRTPWLTSSSPRPAPEGTQASGPG